MHKLECEFKFAKLEVFLKIKPDSDSICKYEKLKLWQSFDIYLMVYHGNHEIDFCDRVPIEKN